MSCEIEIGGKKIEVIELTVRDIRDWFKHLESVANDGAEKENLDPVNWGLFEDAALPDIIRMTKGITEDDLAGMTPSEIEKILKKVREINPHFFGMKKRMGEMGSALLELSGKEPKQ